MKTGYFFSFKRPHARNKMHLVIDGKPICGAVMSKDMEFQWCSNTAKRGWVECKRCLKSLDAWLKKVK